MEELEQQKIALTKEYEKILVEATRYPFDKELNERLNKVKDKIEKIKKALDNNK